MANVPINIFFHIFPINHYQRLINFIFKKNERLFHLATNVFLSINGNSEVEFPSTGNVTTLRNQNLFEFPTLYRIIAHTNSHPLSYILYLHTKGVTYAEKNQCLDDWINYMLYFNVEQADECIDILNSHDTCGVDLRDDPAKHYSGNIWWARSDYIKMLKSPLDVDSPCGERHKCEFWICSGEGRHYEMHETEINVYERHFHRYPPELYRSVIDLEPTGLDYRIDDAGTNPSNSAINAHSTMDINVLKELHLSKTGKCSDKWSSYLDYYNSLFRPFKDLAIQLLEIGIQNGGSLETWAKYFEHAKVFVGCDINPKCGDLVFDDGRISVIVGDVNSQLVYDKVAGHKEFDIIIDDGSYISVDILVAFLNYFPLLKPGGVYLVEDTHAVYRNQPGAGLNSENTVLAFFKRLTDVVNYEFWAHEQRLDAYLSSSLSGAYLKSFLLEGWIESLEFRNSIVTIRKSLVPGHNKIGERLVCGNVADVDPGTLLANGRTKPY